jgi:mRNA interferase RelE/StbE
VASYDVRVTHSAEKEVRELAKSVIPTIWKRIKSLAEEPRPRQSKKLRGMERAYRLRVRDYRVIYIINDEHKLITVVAVKHRREVYR